VRLAKMMGGDGYPVTDSKLKAPVLYGVKSSPCDLDSGPRQHGHVSQSTRSTHQAYGEQGVAFVGFNSRGLWKQSKDIG